MVKITLGEENFVFGEVGKMRHCVSVLLINDLSHTALLKSRIHYNVR